MHCVDWFPTIATLVGYKPATDLQWDGISQWAALTDPSAQRATRSIYIAKGGEQSLRHGDWKLIQSAKPMSPPKLFNIAADPYEKSDLAKAEPQKLAELQALLAAERAKDNPQLPKDLAGLPN